MRTRTAARALALGGLLTTFITTFITTAPAALADAGPWANFQANAQHTGRATNSGPRSITSAWSAFFPDNVDSGVAIATDGTIFSVSTSGVLQALAPDGGQKWVVNFGARVYATPVLGQDGKVLLGDVRGRFRAVTPDTGMFAWSITGLPSVRGTAAVAPDGSIYFGTDTGQLMALDVNGKERFRQRATSGAAITAAPAIAPNGDVYWAAQDGNLKRMSNTGNIAWDLPVGGTIVSAPTIGPDGTVYAGAGSNLVAVDPSGTVKWQLGLGASVMTTPAIAPDGTIVVGADNGVLTAATPGGTVRWLYQTGGAIRSSAAIGADGLVYVGSGDSNFYVLDANGQKLSTYHALDAVDGPAAIAPNGLALAGAKDNHLYAFKDTARIFTQSPPDRLGGDLVRDPATGRVFVLVDGQRRYIPDPATAVVLGLVNPLPFSLMGSEPFRYPEGPALPALAEGSLIQESNGPIYVIQNGQRVWIPTLDAFAAGGYHWESVIQVEDRVARSIPIAVQDGMLIKSTGDRVYLVSGGQRHWITTAAAMAARGYTWSQVHYVNDAAIAAIPEGGPLS